MTKPHVPTEKPRDYRVMWAISMVLLGIGIVLTIRQAMIRQLDMPCWAPEGSA